jgi:hypothetical protein
MSFSHVNCGVVVRESFLVADMAEDALIFFQGQPKCQAEKEKAQ